MRFFRNLKIKKSRILAGVITASMLFSSVPTVTLLANDEQADDPNIIGTTSFETVLEEEEPVESTEAVVDENVTSIPADETEPTEVVTEPSEEPPIETTVEVVEPSDDETVPSEETTVPTEETTIPTEETTVPTTEETTTEPVEETTTEPIEPERWANMVYVESQDEFIESISNLPDSNRLIIITDDNIDNAFQIKSGVAFDGAYVVAVANQSELDEDVAFLNANGIDYARDGQIAINGSVSYSYSYAQRDANGVRVAVIDTGSNSADEIYSVIGEDGSDANGHGTQMCKIVKASGATVISIQAIGSNGKGQITDVYNAIQLANTLDVDYILMSISTRDVGSYSVFKDLVSETISSGTKVVASAGNNNRDASLYMPANISGVITVGALNEDLTKLDVSNYGSVVDFYVVASSTSEAAAKYIAFTLTDETSSIYDTYVDPSSVVPDDNDLGTYNGYPIVASGNDYFVYEVKSDNMTNRFYVYNTQFETNAYNVLKYTVSQNGGYVVNPVPVDLSTISSMSGTDYGTASFVNDGGGGKGYVKSNTWSSTTNGAVTFGQFFKNQDFYCECIAHWGDNSGNTSLAQDSSHASSITASTVYYKATYNITKSGNTYSVQWTVYISDTNDFSDRGWTNKSETKNDLMRVYIYTTGTGSSEVYHVRVWYKDPGNDFASERIIYESDIPTIGWTTSGNGIATNTRSALNEFLASNYPTSYNGKRNWSASIVGFPTQTSGLGKGNNYFDVTVRWEQCNGRQLYMQKASGSQEKELTGDMISIRRFAKNNASYTYSISYYGNGATPGSSTTYPGTWPTKNVTISNNGTGTFSGEYALGWYYIPLNLDPGSIWVHLYNNNGTVYKDVRYSPNAQYSSSTSLKNAPAPYAYTVDDMRRNDFNASLSNGNTHSVTIAGNTLANTHFCIDPNNVYTGSPSGWVDYLTTNATYANLNTILNSTAISRVTGSSNAEKVKNLCKILFAWNGVNNRAGSTVSTTYSEARLQQYVWYLLSIDGYGSYNITPPTYTPNRYLKGTATTFNNVTYNATKLSNNSRIQIPNSGDFIINIGGNFNNTNYEAVVSGGNGKITARIGGSNLYISVDPTATASDISSFSVTLRNKVDLKADGSAFTTADIEEYYGFSVANQNNAQQRRVTAYYYNTQPYYNASITLGLEATQSIRLTKASSSPNCTNGNSNYSLAGTQYKGYYNLNDARANTNAFITLYSDANGKVGAVDGLDKYIDVTLNGGLGTVAFGGTFYIKEVAVGKGYKLDTNIYEVTVSNNPNTAPTVRVLNSNGQATGTITSTGSNGIYTIPMTNEPVLDPFYFTLTKEDNFGLITNASLANAKYRLEIYAEELGINDPVTGHTPKVTYEFTPVYDTSSGKAVATVDLAYLVNNGTVVQGDGNYLRNIYNSSQAEQDFPLGTYRLYESVPPTGYEVSNQVLRFRIYYDTTNHRAAEEHKVEGNDQYGQNTFTYRPDPTDPDGLLITQAEHPVFGYYRLTKSLEDTNVLESPVNRFTYDLRNTTTGDIIATGTIPATINGSPNTNGMILWHYDANRDYYDPTNLSANLKDTYTTRVVLPVYNVSNGSQVKIQYEVREYIPNGSLYYAGNSNIPYTYTTPTGWTGNVSTYYRHTFTLNEGTTGTAPYTENVQNNIEFASVRIQKGKPAGDLLDLTKVSFTLYRRTNGNRIAIATGTVDSNGSITWTRTPSSGLGITTGAESNLTSINELKYLPLGDYRVEESWDKQYINGLDADAQKVVEYFIENTSNRWTRTETDTKVNCYFDFSLTTDNQVENLGNTADNPTVVNNIVSQWLSMNKVVTVAGDASTVDFQIYYVNPDNGNRTLVAKASAQTNGVGTYPVTFTDSTAPRQNDNKEINLPQGQYYIVEAAPNTTYVRKNGTTTNIPYSYTAPADENGNKWSIHWADDEQITADYYYRTITLGNSDTDVKLAVASNTRIESSLEIRKMYDGILPDASFEFEIYYRGNKAAPEHVGEFENQYLVETITVNCAGGSGKSERLEKLPEGWYEIREINATNWKINWQGQGTVTGDGTKIVRADSERLTKAVIEISDNILLFGDVISGVLAMNTISVTPEVFKWDRWDRAVVRDARHTPDNLHLTFFLYDDANGNGVLDDDESEQWRASSDLDDDGKATFSNIPCGNYIIREVATINGYYLTAIDRAFVVNEPVSPTFYMDNQPYTQPVKVTKIDNETNEPLSGAEFDVYVDVNGNGKYDAGTDVIATAWVDGNDNKLIDDGELVPIEITESATEPGVYYSNGELHWNDGDTFGKQYILVETKAPDNYFFVMEDGSFSADNTEISFVINAEDTTAPDFVVKSSEFTIKNQTGTVIVYKIDKDGNFLPGCEFKIYTDEECTNEFATLVENTDEKKYEYKGLGLGTYYLVETDAPDNYETDPNVYEFSITTTEVHPVIDNTEWIAQNEYTGVTGKFMNYVDVKTNLTDKETQEHIATIDDTITLVDVVAYKGLHVGEEYELKGYLYDTKTGEKYLDKNGEPVTATRKFTPETSVGTVELEFTFDYAYDVVTTVAYEYIYRNGKLVGSHTDITDLDQQVKFPSIHTTLVDKVTEEHVAQQREEMTLVDTVTYENLLVGKNYKMTGVLMIKETNAPLLDDEGNPVTAYTEFVAETENGTVDVVFTFKADDLKQTFADGTVKDITLVAFETLTITTELVTDQKVVDHNDIDDVDQTVNIPDIKTSFYDVDLSDEIDRDTAKKNTKVTLTDTVKYTNITPNLTYTMFAQVMVKETNEPLKDAEGNVITKSVTFTPTETSGTVDVVFEDIDTTLVAGQTLVCFETLEYKNINLVIHADIEDNDQTVHVPEIKTTALSVDTEEHVVPVTGTVDLIDYVDYTNLIVGKEYTINGTLMNQETEQPMLDAEGQPIVGTTTFTAETVNGKVEVKFTVDATLLAGTSYVVFEDLVYKNVKLVVHADITDEDQTIDFPNIKTTFFDINFADTPDDNVGMMGESETLVDTVKYDHLTPGLTYTVKGIVMDKATEQPVTINGKQITAETTFTPTEKSGTVDVVFKNIDTTKLAGKTTVCFETLEYNGIEIYIHADIDDNDQTIRFPEISTKLIDTATGDKMVKLGTEVKLIDTITYKGLTPGKKYTIESALRITGMNYLDDGTLGDYYKKTEFTPTEADGEVEIEFVVDSTVVAGQALVAYEVVSYKGIEVVRHTDMFDPEQTVYVADIRTTAKDAVDNDNVIDGASKDQTIIDTVYYENLVPGKEYTITGKLAVKKANGAEEFATDADGNIITASVTFTAEKATGYVEVVFEHIDASKYAGKKLVAFETLDYEGVTLATHADIEDEEQTVNVSLILHVQIAKADKDNIAYYLKDAEITIFYAEKGEDGELLKDADGNIIYTVVKDVNGNDCIAMTDENGNVDFSFYWDETKVYFAKETKAPAGYQICDTYFELTPDENRESLGTCLIKINILDAIIIIPPKTGDDMPLGIITTIAILAVIGIIGSAFFLVKRNKKTTTEPDENPITNSTNDSDDA